MSTETIETTPETAEVVPSAGALKQLGLSRRRWNGLTNDERLAAVIARVERDREKTLALSTLPGEPFHMPGDPSPIVRFLKTFGRPGQQYEYVAVHVHGKGWAVSSHTLAQYVTWHEVLQFAMLREAVSFSPEFVVATDWSAVQ